MVEIRAGATNFFYRCIGVWSGFKCTRAHKNKEEASAHKNKEEASAHSKLACAQEQRESKRARARTHSKLACAQEERENEGAHTCSNVLATEEGNDLFQYVQIHGRSPRLGELTHKQPFSIMYI